ncbi:hypothetical protein U9M48_041031 [Paspalum notatum var. saurae]|uniref:Uncharacterized protein n=1 Tax=Paspalum notatum var. saurae TaxID=547442 RepID=A0AAQ3URQ7_PASNO
MDPGRQAAAAPSVSIERRAAVASVGGRRGRTPAPPQAPSGNTTPNARPPRLRISPGAGDGADGLGTPATTTNLRYQHDFAAVGDFDRHPSLANRR